MNALLDTCALIWLTTQPSLLGERATRLLDDPATQLWLSDCSVWEICHKWQSGKLSLPIPPRAWVDSQQQKWLFHTLKIERTHLFRVTELPQHHKDPFDRLLVAQALESHCLIVTPDPEIAKYPVPICW